MSLKRWLIEPDGTGYFDISDGPTEAVEVVPAAAYDRLEDALMRAARLCEGRDTAMVLQVIREVIG